MLKLKRYQENVLQALADFFRDCRDQGTAAAWRVAMVQQGRRETYRDDAFGDIPCVCVRVPTGGGKTVLAAHALAQTAQALQNTDAPVALWLTPSDTIRNQTLNALKTPGHPYRQVLERYYPQRLRVCDIESAVTDGPREAGRSAVIIVATLQTFRIGDTRQRNVYAFDEALAPHFQGLSPPRAAPLEAVTEADIEASSFLTPADLGRVKTSLANWLHLQRPIVIVDEAHNNRTDKSFKTLRRLNPACVIEMTATPLPGSNVLYHVAAPELKAEEMIKLPILLREHPTGWEDAVRDAILTRRRLEELALSETEYLRPILLFQAQPKGGAVTVDVLRAHLIEQERLPAEQIAVATGSQKELDDVNLFDPAVPVRYVITVEALKEGWDCSFAYVLCCLQKIHSPKDIEQLLGRILRMPYARLRAHEELNRAYAHVVEGDTSQTAGMLVDCLINNMGFNPYEAAQAVQAQLFPEPDTPSQPPGPRPPDFVLTVEGGLTLPLPPELAGRVTLRPTTQGVTLVAVGAMDAALEDFLLSAVPPRQQAAALAGIERHRAQSAALLAPAARGVPFAPVPQLCLFQEGEWCPVERETLQDLGGLDLAHAPVQLANFAIRETVRGYEIDLSGCKVDYHPGESRQLALNEIPTEATEQDLVRWLDRETRQPDINQGELLSYLGRMVRYLLGQGMSLTALTRCKFPLAEEIRREMERLRQIAVRTGFSQALPGMEAASLERDFRHAFTFSPHGYRARPPFYVGRYRFQHHYYEVIHDLREQRKNGQPAEEFLCAVAIDEHPKVRHWIRNVEREPRFSFWLPTATDYFYPDFVVELVDGRLMLIEYKGAVYKTNDDSRDKLQIGHQWEQSSGGRCLFLMAVERDDLGRDVRKQIADKIG